MGMIVGLVKMPLMLLAGVVALALSLLELLVGVVRRLVEFVASHPKSALLLLVGVAALGGMVYFLTRGDSGPEESSPGGGQIVVNLPTPVPAEAGSPSESPLGEEPTVVVEPTVAVPLFLQTRIAAGGSGGGGTVRDGKAGDGNSPRVGVDGAETPPEQEQLRALLSDVQLERNRLGLGEIVYQHNDYAAERLQDYYRASSPEGVFALPHVSWQANYSAGGGYRPSRAYVYVCPESDCGIAPLLAEAPSLLLPEARVYVGAFLEADGRNAYLVAVAREYVTLDTFPPVDGSGLVSLRGSTDGGAGLGTMTLTLFHRVDREGGEDYGAPSVRIVNPDLGRTGDPLELPAGRWDASGQSFDVAVDLGRYLEEDGFYTLALRANTGLEREYVVAYTLEVSREAPEVVVTVSTAVAPTPTPEPTRASSPGKLSQPGFGGLRISQLSEHGWGVGSDFLMLACRARDGSLPSRWPEGLVFSGDGRYLSDAELAVVLFPGDVYPDEDGCYRLAVRFDGLRHWDFCRRANTCGVLDSHRPVLPHYVVLGVKSWQLLDPALRCASVLPEPGEHGCWRTSP